MSMSEFDITENLFQAIDTIIAERAKQLPYDTTQLMTIVDASNASAGIYRVSPDGQYIELVYADNPTYQVGDKVYVTTIGGSQHKFINSLYLQNNGILRINRIFQE